MDIEKPRGAEELEISPPRLPEPFLIEALELPASLPLIFFQQTSPLFIKIFVSNPRENRPRTK
jgi:hypothetical protein